MKNILYYLIPVHLVKKIKNFKIYLSVLYYRKLFMKTSEACGKNIRVYSPVSLKGLDHISVGDNVKLDNGIILEAWDFHNNQKYQPKINIGSNVSLGKNCHVGAINEIEIAEGTLIGSSVLIIDHNHGLNDYSDLNTPPNKRALSSNGPIHIGKNVWIGEKVSILSGVEIGNNSIIGANSVVTKSIPENCIACGIPARIIKKLDNQEVSVK